MKKPHPALPRGAHALPAEEARTRQRDRLLDAVIACVAERGYTATSVADILARAGISRATFYALFSDKEACFLAAYTRAAAGLDAALAEALHTCENTPTARCRALLQTWLSTLTHDPTAARALLVEIHAAGPSANRLRQAAIERFILLTGKVLASAHEGERDNVMSDHFAVRLMMHGALSMVTALIATDRQEELPALEAPLTRLLESAWAGQLAASSIPGG
jgi:AcrR family transcriptional regulator